MCKDVHFIVFAPIFTNHVIVFFVVAICMMSYTPLAILDSSGILSLYLQLASSLIEVNSHYKKK